MPSDFLQIRHTLPGVLLIALAALLSSCGGNSGAEPTGRALPDPPGGFECAEIASFNATWDALYDRSVDGGACANPTCHGEGSPLDLEPSVAWENLVRMPATGSSLPLIDPGNASGSYLWRKLSAKTHPGSVEIAGSPMPSGKLTISPGHLEAWRLWINAGASKTATIDAANKLLEVCLPPSLDANRLEAPAEELGVQFLLPPWPLAGATEREVCFARYYDFTGSVPEAFLNDDGSRFRIGAYQIQQDPQNHHLGILSYIGSADTDHPAYGQWSCLGGESEAAPCDPKDPTECPNGHCISEILDGPGCIGFGPPGTLIGPATAAGFLTQTAFEERLFPEGVYSEIPVKGIQYINSHAFNLGAEEIRMRGAANLLFSNIDTYRLEEIRAGTLVQPIPAYDARVQCSQWEAPRGTHLFELTPHTHRFGKLFWVDDPAGNRILEGRNYSDPKTVVFDPPLILDDADPQERTLTFCALYNNGVDDEDNPDPTTVKRYSRQPPNALIGRCEPTHCWSGRVGEACGGRGDDAACDSALDSEDGLCDACTLRGGVSTEDEMLLLLGAYWIDKEFR